MDGEAAAGLGNAEDVHKLDNKYVNYMAEKLHQRSIQPQTEMQNYHSITLK